MVNSAVSIKGNLDIVLYDENNVVKDKRHVPNLVMTAGKEYIAERMSSNATVIMSHMAVGSQNTAPVVSETTLGVELGRVSLDTTTVTANAVAYVATFPAGTGTGALTEAGIFNSPSAGDMLCRTQFNAINKSPTDAIVITWNVSVL